MSYELKMTRVCPHLVIDEIAILSEDGRTLSTMLPIAQNRVELLLNGILIEDPSNSVYGYSLVRDPDDSDAKLLRFHMPRRSAHETYQVTYYTRRTSCRRCQGRRTEKDYTYTEQGKVETLEGAQKLIHDIRNMLLTQIGSNPFHKWFGTAIVGSVGSKVTSSGIVKSKLEQSVRTALQRYADTQRLQERATPGKVSDSERFGTLIRLNVQQDPVDVTTFHVSVVFTNRSRDLLDTALSISSFQ